MLFQEDKMRVIPALVLGTLLGGAVTSLFVTSGSVMAQSNVKSAQSVQSTDRDWRNC